MTKARPREGAAKAGERQAMKDERNGRRADKEAETVTVFGTAPGPDAVALRRLLGDPAGSFESKVSDDAAGNGFLLQN